MTTKVEEAVAEIAAAIDVIAPKLEGLYDLARTNIKEESRPPVAAATGVYERRLALLTGAKTALDNLLADGYPVLQEFGVPETVLEDLADQEKTIADALLQFSSSDAASLNPVVGTPVPK
jgi:hypothetical protein